ncbi:hypothetical protein [Streptomyces acidiscabies]|uniref:Uncharacterized protein n=1 Tax=Streptomyces acidiscabies TaxID=42234 RepID=A0AAP6BEI9_9ACTN|nr:hypothetical protein [Streptomyces acidiscabies]MBP5941859.1 hypothetical protein [Streptomyces sp. LBUM 1476]MBZ3913292.1 hypothetical protein [Streptomyces acidiscabies]MDX2963282.1 hypothetical protein [Streptomyces acidiscabies]MDX3021500.1 hypothetical protein [Streptomyces acidiscabies]MDX3790259.1 hypothetical protein [Streptomyces acidiscabies]
MEPLTFDYDYLHFRVDRGVFEQFSLAAPAQGFRIPLRWLGATIHYKKPGRPGKLYVGSVRDPGAALYGTDRLAFSYSSSPSFEIPPVDEALFRAYFTEVAALADRRVAAL